jgi:hypothetical protein
MTRDIIVITLHMLDCLQEFTSHLPLKLEVRKVDAMAQLPVTQFVPASERGTSEGLSRGSELMSLITVF